MEPQKNAKKTRGLQITIQVAKLKISSCKTMWKRKEKKMKMKSYNPSSYK
jgi:hypothetical protein